MRKKQCYPGETESLAGKMQCQHTQPQESTSQRTTQSTEKVMVTVTVPENATCEVNSEYVKQEKNT